MSIKVRGTVQGRWGMASNDNVFIIHSSNTEPIKCLCGKLFKELGKRQRLSVSGVGVEQHHEGGPSSGIPEIVLSDPLTFQTKAGDSHFLGVTWQIGD